MNRSNDTAGGSEPYSPVGMGKPKAKRLLWSSLKPNQHTPSPLGKLCQRLRSGDAYGSLFLSRR
ncbi:MAG: hypothetical protein KTR27_03400 [Leptolyngbyaceae cyanobacterium MAG.088]|nr:hypothetical protein [Leptolyngbyaceae cyanobacterium MAG.088]